MDIMGQLSLAKEATHILICKAFGTGQIHTVAAFDEKHALSDDLQALILVQNHSILKGYTPAPQSQEHQIQAPAHQAQLTRLLHIIPFVNKQANYQKQGNACNHLARKIST